MTRISYLLPRLLAVLALVTAAQPAGAQQPATQQTGTRFDITNYRIEAQLIPDQHMLRAGADITLIPLEAHVHWSSSSTVR